MIYTQRCIEQKPNLDENILSLIEKFRMGSHSSGDLDDASDVQTKLQAYSKYRGKGTLEHYWYGVGVGYTDVLDRCLVQLSLTENIKHIIFYSNERNWAYRKLL